MKRIRSIRFLLVVFTSLFGFGVVTPGFAANNVVTSTIAEYDVAVTTPFPAAECIGYPATLSIVFDRVMHITEFIDGPNTGNYHVIYQVTGTLEIVPNDPTTHHVTYFGTYKVRANELVSRKVGKFTFANQTIATGSDGSQLKLLFHGQELFVDGTPRLDFTKVNCIK